MDDSRGGGGRSSSGCRCMICVLGGRDRLDKRTHHHTDPALRTKTGAFGGCGGRCPSLGQRRAPARPLLQPPPRCRQSRRHGGVALHCEGERRGGPGAKGRRRGSQEASCRSGARGSDTAGSRRVQLIPPCRHRRPAVSSATATGEETLAECDSRSISTQVRSYNTAHSIRQNCWHRPLST